MVPRESQQRSTRGKLVSPVAPMLLTPGTQNHLLLPCDQIRVCKNNWRKLCFSPVRARVIQLSQFIKHYHERPEVAHDMVNSELQNSVVRCFTKDRKAQQRPGSQIERDLALVSKSARQLCFAPGLSSVKFQIKSGLRAQALDRLSVNRCKRCSQRSVPLRKLD